MSFTEVFNQIPFEALLDQAENASPHAVESASKSSGLTLQDFASLLSPNASTQLEGLCQQSQALTRQRFGKVMRLFAPLYLSNECINNCKYCGFSRDNPILRVTLSVDDVLKEARALKEQGFRNLLLVAGEHPKFISNGYLADCIKILHTEIPSLSLEIGPMEEPEYRPLAEAGAEGLVVYQETYDRAIYSQMHTAGPKRNFDWRLETPERAYRAGFRRLGIGALYGLADWRQESIAVAAHAQYLLRNCWKAQLTISLPRLRPCAGDFQPLTELSDRHLVQLICALRLFLPDVGIVLSTREPEKLRNGLTPLGITLMSAGSHTEPGGYTGAGQEKVHYTVKGRIQEISDASPDRKQAATGQFDIADQRSAREVAEFIRQLGYEPVWKDWDAVLTA